MPIKILITDRVHERLIKGLENESYIVHYAPKMHQKEFSKIISDYNGVIVNSKNTVSAELIDCARKLKFIGRLGSGLEIIDTEAAAARNIAVINSPEGNRDAVAEHVIGMLLVLFNKLCRANAQVKEMVWQRELNRGQEIGGKTIGIIGFGNTGSRLAKKLSGWDVEIITYDKYKEQIDPLYRFVECVSLAELQRRSDIISLHVPLTDETRYLVNKSFLHKCKKGVILVNTSRGKVVRTGDLIRALEQNMVTGACLDVFENEKVASYSAEEKEMYKRLFQMQEVVCSPHVAGWTQESFIKISEILLAKIKKVITETVD